MMNSEIDLSPVTHVDPTETRVILQQTALSASVNSDVKLPGFLAYQLPRGVRTLPCYPKGQPLFRLIQRTQNPLAWSLLQRCNQVAQHSGVLKDFSQGTSGAYRLDDGNGPLVIFKPVCEEPFAPNNVKDHQAALGSEGFRPGIKSGEGAARETIAYLFDQWAMGGGIAGVPPTFYVESLSGVYHYSSNLDTDGNNKLPKVPTSLLSPQLSDMRNTKGSSSYLLIPPMHSVDVSSRSKLPFSNLAMRDLVVSQNHFTALNRFGSFVHGGQSFDNEARQQLSKAGLSGQRTIQVETTHSDKGQMYYWKQGSLQTFIPFTETIEDFGSEIMSIHEMQIIAFMDLVLCNVDRNEGNLICIRNGRIPEMLGVKGRAFQRLSTKWRLYIANELHNNVHLNGINRSYAETRVTPSGQLSQFHLVPIDHGLVLPEDFNIDDLDIVWMGFKHVHYPPHPGILKLLEKLDSTAIRTQLQGVCAFRLKAWMVMECNLTFLKYCMLERGYSLFETARLLTDPERNAAEFRIIERCVRLALLRALFTYQQPNNDMLSNPGNALNFITLNWQSGLHWKCSMHLLKDLYTDRYHLLRNKTTKGSGSKDEADTAFGAFMKIPIIQAEVIHWRDSLRHEDEISNNSDEELFLQMTGKTASDSRSRSLGRRLSQDWTAEQTEADSAASSPCLTSPEPQVDNKALEEAIINKLRVDISSIHPAIGQPVNEFASWLTFVLSALYCDRKRVHNCHAVQNRVYTDKLTPYLDHIAPTAFSVITHQDISNKEQLFRKITLSKIRAMLALQAKKRMHDAYLLHPHQYSNYSGAQLDGRGYSMTYSNQCLRAAHSTEILRTYFGLNDHTGVNECKHYPKSERARFRAELFSQEHGSDDNATRSRSSTLSSGRMTDRPKMKHSRLTGLPYFDGPPELVRLMRREFCIGASFLSLVEYYCRKSLVQDSEELEQTTKYSVGMHPDEYPSVEDQNLSLSLSEQSDESSRSPLVSQQSSVLGSGNIVLDEDPDTDAQNTNLVIARDTDFPTDESSGETALDRNIWHVCCHRGRKLAIPWEESEFRERFMKLFREYLDEQIEKRHDTMMEDRVQRRLRCLPSGEPPTTEEVRPLVETLCWKEEINGLVNQALDKANIVSNEDICEEWEKLYMDPNSEIKEMDKLIVPNVHREMFSGEQDPFTSAIGFEEWEPKQMDPDDEFEDMHEKIGSEDDAISTWRFAFADELDDLLETASSPFKQVESHDSHFTTWMSQLTMDNTRKNTSVTTPLVAPISTPVVDDAQDKTMVRRKGLSRLKRPPVLFSDEKDTLVDGTYDSLPTEADAGDEAAFGMTRRKGGSALKRASMQVGHEYDENDLDNSALSPNAPSPALYSEDSAILHSELNHSGFFPNGLLYQKRVFNQKLERGTIEFAQASLSTSLPNLERVSSNTWLIETDISVDYSDE